MRCILAIGAIIFAIFCLSSMVHAAPVAVTEAIAGNMHPANLHSVDPPDFHLPPVAEAVVGITLQFVLCLVSFGFNLLLAFVIIYLIVRLNKRAVDALKADFDDKRSPMLNAWDTAKTKLANRRKLIQQELASINTRLVGDNVAAERETAPATNEALAS